MTSTSRPKKKHDPHKVTLAFCRQYVRERLMKRNGVLCPCCGKRNKWRDGRITREMVVALVKMYLRRIMSSEELRELNGDYAKLRHWGLTEAIVRGEWRLTSRGRAFVRGEVEVPRLAWTYKSELKRHSGPAMTVFDCYGSRAEFTTMVARVKSGAKK